MSGSTEPVSGEGAAAPAATRSREPVASQGEEGGAMHPSFAHEVESTGGSDNDENPNQPFAFGDRGDAPPVAPEEEEYDPLAESVLEETEEEEQERHRVLAKPVSLKFCLNYIRNNAERKVLLRQAVIYCIFLAVFTAYGYARSNYTQDHFGARALWKRVADGGIAPTMYHDGAEKNGGTHFKKTFMDLDDAGDWHDWFESVVIPTFYNPLNRNVPLSKKGPIDNHELVGGIRVRTYRVRDHTCDLDLSYYPEGYPQHCFAGFKTDYVDSDPIVHLSPEFNLTINYTHGCTHKFQNVYGEMARYPCGGHIIDFSGKMTFNEAMELARQLRDISLVNLSTTRFIIVEFVTYNRGISKFFSGKLYVEITRGGGWIPTSAIKAFRVYTEETEGEHGDYRGFAALDIIFTVFVVYYWIRFFVLWVRESRRSQKWLRYLFDLWTFFDLINLTALIVNVAFHFEAQRLSKTLTEEEGFTLPFHDKYFELLNYVLELYYLERYLIALNAILSYLKLLSYFRLHPSLNILTRTIGATGQNLIGILIIFVLLVTSYSWAGMVLYGSSIFEYHSTSYAFSTMFLTLLGKFDYAALRREQRNSTFLFFWSFIFLGLFAMLNFITAIIGTAFDEEHGKGRVLPLHVQIRRAKLRHRGKRIVLWCKTFFSSRRYRQDMISDYVSVYRRSLLAADRINEQSIDKGIHNEPAYLLNRETLGQIIPQIDIDYITDEYLDILWQQLVEDFEVENDTDQTHEEEKVVKAFDVGMNKAFLDVFLTKQGELRKSQNVVLTGALNETLAGPSLSDEHGSPLSSPHKASPTSPRKGDSVSFEGSTPESVLAKILSEFGSTDVTTQAMIETLLNRTDEKARLASQSTIGMSQLKTRVDDLEEAVSLAKELVLGVSKKISTKYEKRKRR